MKIVCLEDRLQIICEDARDEAFLKNNLKVSETGRIFAKMSTYQGKYDDVPMIEVFPYLGKEDRDAKRVEADKRREIYNQSIPYQKV